MRVAIIDCGAGNLHSVRKAFARQLPAQATLDVTTDAAMVRDASHIVLPGVGAFADCMAGLNALPGMRAVLEEKVRHGQTPFLGVCVGMQMLYERSHEHGITEGLGWFAGEVKRLTPADAALKIPHMGWNRLALRQSHPLMAAIKTGDFVYFVHSYGVSYAGEEAALATVDYGGEYVAVTGRGHIVGTQFHPEKSQAVGLRLISNFLGM